ncbi:unnamed protein product [Aphanomyces euteiches]|uniref:Cysteine/serine-rich nuclear protein N-terminal domain-containing protein n=1 Tax=Aphanomyces euteiches TaxID=100861 RepID=A0A6G0WSQ5_9STRA|nr:hypothetical protein Ae201684_011942 [Aphanomyces euteiches]KAH9055965.1 hypothetical protein Ae201684P_021705 [Aphanomyces euteiches]KAH9139047.1 hypothetical protein AeRB84_016643 [Aphanomyces euteiches]
MSDSILSPTIQSRKRGLEQLPTQVMSPLEMREPTQPSTTETKKKQVAFTTATTYYFPLEYGGSAVPKEHGPPIGLAKQHSREESANLNSLKSKRGRVRKFDHAERMRMLEQLASYTRKEVAMFCFEAIEIRKSRLETEYEDNDEDTKQDTRERPSKRRKASS